MYCSSCRIGNQRFFSARCLEKKDPFCKENGIFSSTAFMAAPDRWTSLSTSFSYRPFMPVGIMAKVTDCWAPGSSWLPWACSSCQPQGPLLSFERGSHGPPLGNAKGTPMISPFRFILTWNVAVETRLGRTPSRRYLCPRISLR